MSANDDEYTPAPGSVETDRFAYLVFAGEHEDVHVVAVYDSRRLALMHARRIAVDYFRTHKVARNARELEEMIRARTDLAVHEWPVRGSAV